MFSKILYTGGLGILVMLSLAFFLNMPVYFMLTERGSMGSAITLLLLAMIAVFFFLFGGSKVLSRLPFGFYGGCIMFAMMVIASSAFFSDEFASEARRTAIWGSIYILLFGGLFTLSLYRGHDVRVIFMLGGVVAVLLNVVDYFDRGLYFEALEGFGVRAAGFFVNANKAAEAILFSMAVSITYVSRRYRVLFCYFCLVGVILTLSRGGMVGWLLLFLMFMAANVISRSIAVLSLVGGFFVSGMLISFFEFSSDFVDITLLADRLVFIAGGNSGVLQDDRVGLAGQAFDLFASSPLYGNGVYALLREGAPQLSHNEYFQLGSDFGVIGLLIYFVILYFCWVRRETGAMLAFVFILYWGLFSHNILDSYVFCMGLAYLAALRVHLLRAGTIMDKDSICAD